MFIVDSSIYTPMKYRITVGILVNILLGSKNQKIPTPRVKSIGNIIENKVAFLPKPS
jgi:hypothetical protein